MKQLTNGLEDFGTNIPEHTPVAVPQGDPGYPESPEVSFAELSPDEYADMIQHSNNRKGKAKEYESRITQWTEVAKNTYLSSPQTVDIIAPGVYKYIRWGQDRYAFQKQPINVDELLVMPDSLTDKILEDIQSFLNKADKYKHYNFLHRRGFMFYGPHGSGKSSLVQQILKKVIDQNGVVLLCEHPGLLELGLLDLRRVEKDRFIVCLFEDIDALIEKFGEKEILAVLDGESQVNKVLNVATTNYPEHLDPRIVGRPRRFDRVIRIDWPNDGMRRHFFKHKLKIEDVELDKWVAATDRFSFAACAELVISVKCLDKDFEDSVQVLKDLMKDKKPSSNEYDIKSDFVGFGKRR